MGLFELFVFFSLFFFSCQMEFEVDVLFLQRLEIEEC